MMDGQLAAVASLLNLYYHPGRVWKKMRHVLYAKGRDNEILAPTYICGSSMTF